MKQAKLLIESDNLLINPQVRVDLISAISHLSLQHYARFSKENSWASVREKKHDFGH